MRRSMLGLTALLLFTLVAPPSAEGHHGGGKFTQFTRVTCFEENGNVLRYVGFRTTAGEVVGVKETKTGEWGIFSQLYAIPGPKPVCIKVNNTYLQPDVAPVIEQGRTLVPLRAIAESFSDVTIDWDNSTRTVILRQSAGNGITWTLRPDDPIVMVTDLNRPPNLQKYPKTLDVPPTIREARTLVPLRFIAETLGAQVKWDDSNRRVVITREEGV